MKPPTAPPIAVVMAAGRGSRMGSALPKVLFEAAGRPLVRWVLDALAASGVADRIVVVGYRADQVRSALEGLPGVSFAIQETLRGTGDAVAAASALIRERLGSLPAGTRLPVVVVCGDSPMLRPASVRTLLDAFDDRQADCVLGTATTNDPAGLGRIVREPDGRFRGIVEEKDASPTERLIHEVNMSTYVFEAASLVRVLTRLDTANAAGEYYITDCPRLLLTEGRRVAAIDCLDSSETLSVNTPEQLAAVAAALAGRESPPS